MLWDCRRPASKRQTMFNPRGVILQAKLRRACSRATASTTRHGCHNSFAPAAYRPLPHAPTGIDAAVDDIWRIQ